CTHGPRTPSPPHSFPTRRSSDLARFIVVHGGGPQATALSQRLGIEPRLVGGRRITDAATLEVIKMVVAGQLNVDLVAALRAAGVDRKSTRLNSSHQIISYAVFCL